MSKLISDIKLHTLLLLLLAVLYPLLLLGIGALTPEAAHGFPLIKDGVLVGYKNIGQEFVSDRYFNSRPSVIAYNPASSGGSNKSVGNRDYLLEIQKRRAEFLQKNKLSTNTSVPSDMVTASGSGLDPHISVAAALLQVNRVAENRGITVRQVTNLIDRIKYKPLFGFAGYELVNVLQLNTALDSLGK